MSRADPIDPALCRSELPAMLWPVWSFANPHKPIVAWFFDWGSAVDFVNSETERNLYIGSAKYDPRVAAAHTVQSLSDPFLKAKRSARA